MICKSIIDDKNLKLWYIAISIANHLIYTMLILRNESVILSYKTSILYKYVESEMMKIIIEKHHIYEQMICSSMVKMLEQWKNQYSIKPCNLIGIYCDKVVGWVSSASSSRRRWPMRMSKVPAIPAITQESCPSCAVCCAMMIHPRMPRPSTSRR